jgi:hypothetical protein
MATAKLNREKLEEDDESQQDEAPLVWEEKEDRFVVQEGDGREKSPPSSSCSRSRPFQNLFPTVVVEVIEIPAEPSSSRSLERCRRCLGMLPWPVVGPSPW